MPFRITALKEVVAQDAQRAEGVAQAVAKAQKHWAKQRVSR